jgi:hypothetical protein
MKVRSGFVSNSSTSSFLIYGLYFEDMKKLAEILAEKFAEQLEELDDFDDYEIIEELMEHVYNLYKVQFFRIDKEGYYIGRSWSDVNDDETGSQFKNCVKQGVKDLLGDEVESDSRCQTYKAAWYS